MKETARTYDGVACVEAAQQLPQQVQQAVRFCVLCVLSRLTSLTSLTSLPSHGQPCRDQVQLVSALKPPTDHHLDSRLTRG